MLILLAVSASQLASLISLTSVLAGMPAWSRSRQFSGAKGGDKGGNAGGDEGDGERQ